MANITVKDLTAYSDSGSFIRDLSDAELDLQGGGLFKVLKKIVKAIGSIFDAVEAVASIFGGGGGSSGGRNEHTHLH
ncbi:hypothetical protein [Chamaesiphon polymorphus]|jgi:hypothetical protein|uniref:Bacteriocin n=1 Tax=Chamaesiphon polymorphus CCALA 037 TaxID=2107692 RepID=A0A2T1GG01_9CYAN|nr:hypothetical protein [Chamaesiphon polymorphus]PSB56548.1 hypothetical protein C7B77_11535 [Chamaesiphon polymorphus CCALA 037]